MRRKVDEPDKFAECREAAWLLVDQAWAHKRRGTLSEAANGLLDRMLIPMYALYKVENGEFTNPGEIYYWGVKLGVAAEGLRICLESPAIYLGLKNHEALDGGRKTNTNKRAMADAKVFVAFEQAKRSKPNLDSERAWCEEAARILNEEHKEQRARALMDGVDPAAVEERWAKWTMGMVRARIQKQKKEQK